MISRLFTNFFVRYGAGREHFRAITQTRWWNAFCWVMIVIGIVGWAVFIFWPY